jgi:hypothetical protein
LARLFTDFLKIIFQGGDEFITTHIFNASFNSLKYMKFFTIIKLLSALGASFLISTTLASAYTSYVPIVNSKHLSVIISVAILLGLLSMYQKRT